MSETNYYQLDDIRERMKAAPDGIENKEFLNELIDMNHFGNLRRVEHQDVYRKHMSQMGLGPRYENWHDYVRCSVCDKVATMKCPDTDVKYCSEECYQMIAGKRKIEEGSIDRDNIKFNCMGIKTFDVSSKTWSKMGWVETYLEISDEVEEIHIDQDPDIFQAVLNVIIYNNPPLPSNYRYREIVQALNYFMVDIPEFERVDVTAHHSGELFSITGTPITANTPNMVIVKISEYSGTIGFFVVNTKASHAEFNLPKLEAYRRELGTIMRINKIKEHIKTKIAPYYFLT